MQFLKMLPETFSFSDIAVVHGSPRDPNEYVYPTMPVAELSKFLDRVGKHVLVLGHTHVQWSLELDSLRHRRIINPGAVGQPRDGNPKAAYAIFDTKSRELTMHRVKYDIEEVASKTISAGLPPYLAQRLFLGI
jgi:diadenosine tetraphosphatase ApaH/serine/threonine PP2A family protein phosphatase